MEGLLMVILIKLFCLVTFQFALSQPDWGKRISSHFHSGDSCPDTHVMFTYGYDVTETFCQCSLVFGHTVNFTDPLSERVVEVDEFLGIPFATLEDEAKNVSRFKPSIHVLGVHPAVHRMSREKGCIQQTSTVPWSVQPEDKESLSEDCLFMNIWTPFNQSKIGIQNQIYEKPVLFWIHGGFFTSGSNQQEIYDGRVLAGLGDVVVVTVSYRLGALGFWTSGRESAPENNAMLDIIRGVDWCLQYINFWGGNPDLITLAGQGAGAVAAGFLSVGRRYALPWRRLILQSGSPIETFTPRPMEALIHSYDIAKLVGCANESYSLQDYPEEIEACMRNVDPFLLMTEEASLRLRPGPYASYLPTWGRSSMGTLIDNRRKSKITFGGPEYEILKDHFNFEDLLIGHNMLDGAFEIAAFDPIRFGVFGENDFQISDNEEAKGIFLQMFPMFIPADLDEVFERYEASGEFENEDSKPRAILARAVTDFLFGCASNYFAQLTAKQGVNVYYYYFNFKSENSQWAPWMRPTHFEEVQYLFGRPFLHLEEYDDPNALKLSKKMIEMWTNFVKNGVPSETWRPYLNASHLNLPPWIANISQNPDEEISELSPVLHQCEFFFKYGPYSVPDRNER